MDLNGARRKNATRETTSTLKAWLNEHKKNPYPTKGEKIMLAIITKMTLTQVSTWFANARRRLKKENKMTWEPRNRVDDEDNNNEDASTGRKSAENKDNLDSKDSGTASSEDGDRGSHRLDFDRSGSAGNGNHGGDTGSEWSESRPDSPECLFLAPPYQRFSSPPSKPRIWSLADMANKDETVRTSVAPDPALLDSYSRMAAAHSSQSMAAVVAAAAAAAAAGSPAYASPPPPSSSSNNSTVGQQESKPDAPRP
ncbi:hypothetical protein O3M35_002779 [Rhynocoris fuscipes]|uniref:Homeobox domain-containing protein n=1 Tax=Rhynocoris fuscipes TaxID=488301 RepID=A0AAW1CU55_9HEMI